MGSQTSRITSNARPWVLLALAAAVFAYLAGWGSSGSAGLTTIAQGAVALLPGRDGVRQALRAAAVRYGIDPDWLDALGWQESRWNAAAVNNTGGDAARGGSYGPTQISATTARAFGYQGDMDALSDPSLAAELTAQMVSQGFAERSGVVYRYGPPASLEQLAAVWNAGRLDTDPALPLSTDGYIASITAAADTLPLPPVGVA